MTRGQIVLVHNDGILTSTEFNGSMYYEEYGKEVICGLELVKTVKDYKAFVKAFNAKNFQYDETLTYNALQNFAVDEMLDMTVGYFDKWFSDYLYIKNICSYEVVVTDARGNGVAIMPNGILMLNYGKYNSECQSYSINVEDRLSDKARDICESLGWYVVVGDDGEVQLEKSSPAGEDFIFYVSVKGFVKEVEDYAYNFDADEHAEMWVSSRGTRGVPSSIRDLINDADAIQEMLDKLAHRLTDLEEV